MTYEQKCDGFVLISVNDPPDGPVQERLRTIASVTRNIPSCTECLPRPDDMRGVRAPVNDTRNGVVSYNVPDAAMTTENKRAILRPLFFGCLAVEKMGSMMQWTGVLGDKQCASQVAEVIVQIAYTQLGLSKALLNPVFSSVFLRPKIKFES